ncbi:MAG TPA: bifunctional enoyl-CoA hydratase/phosphate acetyltransferase [Candidatus Marinimicrobia bacterium]|nr:bifunctional enoyl-CoA hydratase/phosphate acetyltransferase [Candidatus Neomarinimicrobiota bacterium]HRS50820.1 bifunctional enoyl-CoA hydratase/phosphate acetyltransferase [Candidatus Neomarinimicrobiota bacterium]HRU91839.1 bifunctional enoyl-CoA hydratase/phosphate acetyltransferase [Candidatus Neomarinimicrobiota bacterium]
MIKTYSDIFEKVKKNNRRRTISIALAEDKSVLEAVKVLAENNMARVRLTGNPNQIRSYAEQVGYPIKESEIVAAFSEEEAATRAVEQVRLGKAEILMKGHTSTPALIKAVLDKETGLRTGGILSHISVVEIPTYHKLLMITDGGINIAPDLEKKKAIIQNAIIVAKKLEIARPKIAVLSPIEKVNPKIPETVDAIALQEMAERGEFGSVILEGPIAADIALSSRAAERKGLTSRIAGDTDIVLVPNITCGNAVIKFLMFLAKAKVGGVVIGARVPIVLLSRSDEPAEKFNSTLLALLITTL